MANGARFSILASGSLSLAVALGAGCFSSSATTQTSADSGVDSSEPAVDSGEPDSTTAQGVACTPGSCAAGQTCCLTGAVPQSGGAVVLEGVCQAVGACASNFSVACTAASDCTDAGATGACCASLTVPAGFVDGGDQSLYLPPAFDLSQFNPATFDASGFDASGFGLTIQCQASCSDTQIPICTNDPSLCGAGTVCYGPGVTVGATLNGVMGCVPTAWLSDAGLEGGAASDSEGPESSASDASDASDATYDSEASTDAAPDAPGRIIAPPPPPPPPTCTLQSLTTCGGNGQTTDPCTDNFYCGATGNCTGYTPDAGNYAGENCTGDYLVCNAGVCGCQDSSQVSCSGQCIDPSTSTDYCGATGNCFGSTPGAANYAGVRCPTGGTCTGGQCSCPANEIGCGSSCVDPMTNAGNCGAAGTCQGTTPGTNYAGVNCGGGTCTGGVCTCQGTQIVCGNYCVDTTSDPTNCGATGNCQGTNAGTTCATGYTCLNSTCTPPCPTITNSGSEFDTCVSNGTATATRQGGTITPGTYVANIEYAYYSSAESACYGDTTAETVVVTSTTISDITGTSITGWSYVTSGSTLTATQTCGQPTNESTWSLVNGYTALSATSFDVFEGNASYETVITFTMQ
jgi:hypothetical protein